MSSNSRPDIVRKLEQISRYPDDIYDIVYIVISQQTITKGHRRAVPFSMLASEITELVKECHALGIDIYQSAVYKSDLCLIMNII